MLGTSVLKMRIIGCRTTNAMELILFPSYFNPCTNQDVFHGGTVELCQIFVELPIREESLAESIYCRLLVTEWDGDLLFVELSHVVWK